MSSRQQPDILTRLRAANPAAVDPDRGRSEVAQAGLKRIVDDPVTNAGTGATRRDRWRPRRGIAIVFAAALLAGGGALAATDPFGWWSPNPGEAKYGANPALHVRTPTVQYIICRSRSADEFRCSAGRSGQRYSLIDAIHAPSSLTRAGMAAGIAQQLAAGKISSTAAARFRADLAAVPDSFFRKFQIASRFGTYGGGGDLGNGRTLAPPPGVPVFLVCENAAAAGLTCQNLNGDNAAPVGAGVYVAEPNASWRPAPPSRQSAILPPGLTFTAAEYRLLIDMVLNATTSSTSTSGPAPTGQ